MYLHLVHRREVTKCIRRFRDTFRVFNSVLTRQHSFDNYIKKLLCIKRFRTQNMWPAGYTGVLSLPLHKAVLHLDMAGLACLMKEHKWAAGPINQLPDLNSVQCFSMRELVPGFSWVVIFIKPNSFRNTQNGIFRSLLYAPIQQCKHPAQPRGYELINRRENRLNQSSAAQICFVLWGLLSHFLLFVKYWIISLPVWDSNSDVLFNFSWWNC